MSKLRKAHILSLSENDCKEKLLRLSNIKSEIPSQSIAPEDSVPDVDIAIPSGMEPITIRWGNGKSSKHFIYAERYLLRKNKAPIAEFFNDIDAKAGTKLVMQKIGPLEFAICELAVE